MAPPRRRTRSTGMSPGAMGGRVGSGITSVSSRPTPSRNNNRQQRRAQQQKELDQFKSTLKVAPGTTNLYQEQAPKFNPQTGRYERTTLAQKAMELSNKYGPTPRELLGDIGSGIGSIAGGLMNKVSSGDFGIIGIAKGLYEKFSDRANQAKDFLGQQVNKLSDIDLEILKNKNKYKLISQKPDIQLVNQLESNAKLAAENRNLFGDYYGFGGPSMPGKVEREPIETLVPSTLYGMPQQPPGFKVMPPGQRELLAEIMASDVGNNNQNNMQIQNGQVSSISNQQFDDALNKSNEIFGEESIFRAEGGSVDNKLNDMQKSTNNIYGTGILSVR